MPLRSVKMNRFILGFQRRVWCPKWVPLSSSCFMVTTAIVGHSFVSVVARHRVKPGPGACCDAGPCYGTARHAVRTPSGTGDAGQTREVSPRTSCDEQFTPTQLVVFPARVHTAASVHRLGKRGSPSRRRHAELMGCGGQR